MKNPLSHQRRKSAGLRLVQECEAYLEGPVSLTYQHEYRMARRLL